MILDYVNEAETPHLNRQERLMILIYLLGITNQKQLQVVTSWSKSQITETLSCIRKQAKKPKERDEWLEFFRTKPTEPFLYKLGQKGIEYVTALRDESMGNGRRKKKPHQWGHWGHLVGFNEILCRLIKEGVEFEEFLVGKEVLSFLYSESKEWRITRDGIEVNRIKIPFRPDGLVIIRGKTYYLEYDSGTESRTRILSKLENYITALAATGDMHPVLWVCRTETRKKAIERYARELQEKLNKSKRKPDFPTMYCAVEGADTKFLAGELDIAPFWQ